MDWHLIISLATLVLVIFTIVWGTGLWLRREKIEIKIESMCYNVDDVYRKVKVYWGGKFKRSGRKETRYITKIYFKPDRQTYGELQQYISLPGDGVIKIDTYIELPRDKIGYSGYGDEAFYPEYDAFSETNSTEKWRIARQLASELSQKRFEVGLVWEDGGKTKWKMISSGELGKWVRL